MLSPSSNCKVCKEVEKNPKLLKDIYNSTAFLKTSSLTLKQIHQEYELMNGRTFTYESLLNHTKKHQRLNEKDLTNRNLRQIANQAEKTILARKIESMQVWDKVIDQGMEKLADGSISLKTGDLLRAAKDKSDYELKTKDQQLAMMEMVMHFASGENNESGNYDRKFIEGQAEQDKHSSPILADGTDAGEDGPSDVYYPPAWDAAT